MPPAPLVYQLMIWRREMGVSYLEMLATPLSVIQQDLQMLSLENRFKE